MLSLLSLIQETCFNHLLEGKILHDDDEREKKKRKEKVSRSGFSIRRSAVINHFCNRFWLDQAQPFANRKVIFPPLRRPVLPSLGQEGCSMPNFPAKHARFMVLFIPWLAAKCAEQTSDIWQ